MEEKSIEQIKGQDKISVPIALWLILLVICWAANSVVVKFIVEDMPSSWAAFLRFSSAYPFIVAFVLYKKTNLKVNFKQFAICCLLSSLTFTQIMLFNIGSQYTTGARVTMLIFTYPLLIPFIAHFFLKGEKLNKKTVIGIVLAFLGLLIPLHHALTNDITTLKGDFIELGSSITLAFLIVTNKYGFTLMDKWTLFFWQSTINLFFFAPVALLSSGFDPKNVGNEAWLSLAFQAFVISVFAFLSYQYILSKHNSSKVAVFFFATPLFGMLISGWLHKEPFQLPLLIGCLSVGFGIFVANKK